MGPHTAVVLEGVLKAVHRVQHKVGCRAHQAEVVLNSACWAKSSRKQAPACYTSARHHASRCETGTRLHWDQGPALAHAANGYHGHWHEALGQCQKVQASAASGPQGQLAGGPRQKGLLPVGSSQRK